jgi:uncharacterized protein DUF3558
MSIHARLLPGAVALALFAGGCSQSAAPDASPAAASAAPLVASPAAAAPLEADSPCRLLTDAEVRAVFPGAKPGAPERSREEYGIKACEWDTDTDRFVVQVWTAKGSVDDEIRGLASGFVEPFNAGAQNNIRYETIAGVGEQAMAVVETQDQKRGILSDAALLVAKHGNQILELQSQQLPHRARATALQALTTLGHEAVARM